MMHSPVRRRALAALPSVVLLLSLSACASLPSSGPTGGTIRRTAEEGIAGTALTIQEVRTVADLPAKIAPVFTALPDETPPASDAVGPGDVMDIVIYEAGASLFTGRPTLSLTAPGAIDFNAKGERLPPIRVDDQGTIMIPYIGRMRVAGRTTTDIARAIENGLRGRSQEPQVLVTLRDVTTNSVIVGGEVVRAGRLPLPAHRTRISDAVALSGGYRGDPNDLAVRVQRDDKQVVVRLTDLLAGDASDVYVVPGDRLSVIRSTRSYSVLGAANKVDQFAFTKPNPDLAEAVARAGGTNPNIGNPRSVFVFRFVTLPDGTEEPRVYHINFQRAGAYLLAQRFYMRDRDVLYIGNAWSNDPMKMLQIVGQVFAPLVTATSLVNIATD